MSEFFPYHPLRFRLLLGGAALMSATLAAWAVAGFARGGGLVELARAGLSLGLFAAMVTMARRLRPRQGWGVKVGSTALLVSRPMRGEIEIPWSTVREVHRLGKKRDTLVLSLGDERRVLVPLHLFRSPKQFERLVFAIEARLPSQPYDA